ncbi:hypothetical protein Y032_0116g532 [Ancylostoma ceylanicum]|uniref:Uncharacterized protein n=1 Tax=Ancylostoma ceylanicum TaxID=53326 RepID=A0A016TBC5_9BILA|nr:hypothetical protein Y032_0116g532 [Ancylostoma ceylanicum]
MGARSVMPGKGGTVVLCDWLFVQIDQSQSSAALSSPGIVLHIPRTDTECECEKFYQLDELIARIVREDRRCFGEGPPFFPNDRVVWRTRNFWRCLSQRGWNFDGSQGKIPLCFTHFTLFSPNQVCYLCGVETKDFHGLYKSLFDFPRDFSYVVGEVEKTYGDCCCCDVRFGKSSFIFHIPTKMLRLAD